MKQIEMPVKPFGESSLLSNNSFDVSLQLVKEAAVEK